MIPNIEIQDTETAQSPSKTWRLDLTNNCISGFIDGIDAVLQSSAMALQTERYEYLIFSWQYGSELHTLVGKDPDYVFSEAKRMIPETLSTDERITNIHDFSFDNGIVRSLIDTVFGSRAAQTEVAS